MASSEPILALCDVAAGYGAISALRGVSLAVGKGEIVCLIGANGAGKSSTLNTISRVLPLTQGSIHYRGEPMARWRPSDVVRRGIVQVPEGRLVFPDLTVFENLEMGAYTQPRHAFKQRLEGVYRLFPRLVQRHRQLAGLMSGGEQQMLAIGRALMAGPEILLLDEPSMGLAPLVIADIFKTLRQLKEELGLTILLVEQNAAAALQLADRGYVLVNGRITREGSASALLHDESIQEAFLGKSHGPGANGSESFDQPRRQA